MIPYGYVYRIVNRLDGRTYVGQRKLSRDKSWRQYLGSGHRIVHAVAKHGEQNFTKQLLAWAYDVEELCLFEMLLIKAEKARGRGEYNIATSMPAWDFDLLPEERQKQIRENWSRAARQRSNAKIPFLLENLASIKAMAQDKRIALKAAAQKLDVHYGTLQAFVDENKIVWAFDGPRKESWQSLLPHESEVTRLAQDPQITLKETAERFGVYPQLLQQFMDDRDIAWECAPEAVYRNVAQVRAAQASARKASVPKETISEIRELAKDETVGKKEAAKQVQLPYRFFLSLLDLHRIDWLYCKKQAHLKRLSQS